jgi:hypothetical protein
VDPDLTGRCQRQLAADPQNTPPLFWGGVKKKRIDPRNKSTLKNFNTHYRQREKQIDTGLKKKKGKTEPKIRRYELI